MTYAKKTRALIVALAMTLLVASPTFAASSSSSETLTVAPQLTMTGVPASITYTSGSNFAGTTFAAPTFNVVIGTNNPNGYKFEWTANDLTSNGNTIAVTNRLLQVTAGTVTCAPSSGYSTGKAFTGAPLSSQTICAGSTAPAGTETFAVTPKVAVPSGAVPGTYSGTITFTATNNP